jgi:hypothetical protein
MISRPEPSEYDPYYQTYIDKTNQDDGLEALRFSHQAMLDFLDQNLNLEYQYAPEKWTVRQVVMHIIDTERIFGYRALRIARGDSTPLPGFDQDLFAENSRNSSLSWEFLCMDFEQLARSTELLFESFEEDDLIRIGTANENRLSVRAAAFIIAGHNLHHLDVFHQKYML